MDNEEQVEHILKLYASPRAVVVDVAGLFRS